MAFHVVHEAEGFVAELAFEGLDTGVSDLVTLQLLQFFEP